MYKLAVLSETRFADIGRSKKMVLDTPCSGADAKVKKGVKQELALPLKQNLLISCINDGIMT